MEATLHSAAVLTGDPDETALIYIASDADPVTVTRGQFRHEVAQMGGALAARGLGAGDLVLIAHTQSRSAISAFWGALWIGAIPSMFPTLTEKLDPARYRRDMADLARISGARAVVTTDAFAATLTEVIDAPVLADADLSDAVPVAPVTPEPDSIAFLQHSSGTTGLQKGVALSHRAVGNQLAAYADAIALTPDDVIVSWLPLYHDMGLIAGFLLPLVLGNPLMLMSPFDWVRHPALLLRAIDRYGGTLCWLPNFAYNHLARRVRRGDTAGLSLATMRAFINCSEPVRADSHAAFVERFAPLGVTEAMLAVSYALAENTFAATQTPTGQPPRLDRVDRAALEREQVARPAAADDPAPALNVSCGPPLGNTELRILDAAGAPLPDRQVGQIALRSDCMLSGYYRRPDLAPLVDGWYHTGDMGYIADGELYVIGRAKDIIINAGKNIYPADIEAVVNTVEGVYPGRVCVFGVPDAREGTELIAVVAEAAPGVDPAAHGSIKAAIRAAVAAQTGVSASYVDLVDGRWLLKTSSGKIARASNRDKWLVERG
jgi:acyl-CoA synthetase (AMP-forming)/AMP-acid ligase II